MYLKLFQVTGQIFENLQLSKIAFGIGKLA